MTRLAGSHFFEERPGKATEKDGCEECLSQEYLKKRNAEPQSKLYENSVEAPATATGKDPKNAG